MEIPHDLNSIGTEQFTYDQAEDYIQSARDVYRSGVTKVDYRGRRSEKQKELAASTLAEASEFFDTYMESLMTYGVVATGGDTDDLIEIIPSAQEEKDVKLGDANGALSLDDMKQTWSRLWVGFNILTDRIGEHSKTFKAKGYTSLSTMKSEQRYVVMHQLFNDFQDINALRFGAHSVGLSKSRRKYDENFDAYIERFDPDRVADSAELSSRAARVGYTVLNNSNGGNTPATHTAGKLSPEEVRDLRREYPEIDPERFMNDVNFYKNVIAQYRENNE